MTMRPKAPESRSTRPYSSLKARATLMHPGRAGGGSGCGCAGGLRRTLLALGRAITLAGVLTFPLAMPNGSPFPARELCILIAAGVIVLSLTWANVSLLRLLTGLTLPPDDSYEDEEDCVRRAAAQAAMRAVQRAQERLSLNGDDADLYTEAADDVLALYRTRLEGRRRTADRSRRPASCRSRAALVARGREGRA